MKFRASRTDLVQRSDPAPRRRETAGTTDSKAPASAQLISAAGEGTRALAHDSPRVQALARLQAMAADSPRLAAPGPLQTKAVDGVGTREGAGNKTGIPDPLKAGLERLSGLDLSAVRVHYRSAKPARLGALAFARGRNIEMGPGQEKHLPHEAWHAVQQMQGRVKATGRIGEAPLNDEPALEREAEAMGARARSLGGGRREPPPGSIGAAPQGSGQIVQRIGVDKLSSKAYGRLIRALRERLGGQRGAQELDEILGRILAPLQDGASEADMENAVRNSPVGTGPTTPSVKVGPARPAGRRPAKSPRGRSPGPSRGSYRPPHSGRGRERRGAPGVSFKPKTPKTKPKAPPRHQIHDAFGGKAVELRGSLPDLVLTIGADHTGDMVDVKLGMHILRRFNPVCLIWGVTPKNRAKAHWPWGTGSLGYSGDKYRELEKKYKFLKKRSTKSPTTRRK